MCLAPTILLPGFVIGTWETFGPKGLTDSPSRPWRLSKEAQLKSIPQIPALFPVSSLGNESHGKTPKDVIVKSNSPPLTLDRLWSGVLGGELPQFYKYRATEQLRSEVPGGQLSIGCESVGLQSRLAD